MKWWIEHIPPDRATGKLKKQYERFPSDSPMDHIILAHSPLPNAMDALMRFYKGVMHGQNDLPYVDREIIAVTVSVLNRCHY